VKYKTSELTGELLDAAVAKAEGIAIKLCRVRRRLIIADDPDATVWCPSDYWGQGGEIIERERIRLAVADNGDWWAERRLFSDGRIAYETSYDKVVVCRGGTPLIAAMRAYVASKLGEEVELP
jgi:hypothetical protein